MNSGYTYELENDIDFFKELKKITADKTEPSSAASTLYVTESDTDPRCLITDEKLRKDHIALECGHKFNYVPLFKEVLFQKCSLLPKNISSKLVTTYTKNLPVTSLSQAQQPSSSPSTSNPNVLSVTYNSSYNLETTKLQYNEIKCPYCRTITPYILPFYPYPDVCKVKYVNTPANLALPTMSCEYYQYNTSTKETSCRSSCIYYDKYDMMLCNKHFNKYETEAGSKSLSKTTRRKAKPTEINVDDENIIISHHNPATSVCAFQLLSGPRKGCPCGKPMWIPKISTSNISKPVLTNAAYCKTHYDKGICQ
jgi:hypothetical protein